MNSKPSNLFSSSQVYNFSVTSGTVVHLGQLVSWNGAVSTSGSGLPLGKVLSYSTSGRAAYISVIISPGINSGLGWCNGL